MKTEFGEVRGIADLGSAFNQRLCELVDQARAVGAQVGLPAGSVGSLLRLHLRSMSFAVEGLCSSELDAVHQVHVPTGKGKAAHG